MEIVSNQPIEPSEVYKLIKKDMAGSVVLHFAVVRRNSEGKATSSIDFQASGDVNEELRIISDDIRRRWTIEDILIMRRLGRLDIGDIISLAGVSSTHREDAFEACRYGVDRLKKMSTISKRETFE